MSPFRCSIIVPTADRTDSLALALHTLLDQSVPKNVYEIIVVHNGRTDGTGWIGDPAISVYSPHAIRHLCDPIPGLLTGRHRGALEATGDILVFVDDDIEADPDWLQAIVDTFSDETVQLVGGRNLPRFEAPPPAWIDGFRHSTPYGGWALGYLSLLDLGDEMLDIEANYMWGLNFAIRRQALFDLGGFHPDNIPDHLQHFQGDGESGLTMKAKERGYRAVYQPKALVHHRIPASRLTPEYFERRAFYQGVCDSYTQIRLAGGVSPLPWATTIELPIIRAGRLMRHLPHYARHPLRYGQEFGRRLFPFLFAKSLAQVDKELDTVKSRTHRAYWMGYEYHRNAVRQEPLLLDWVMRKDYWDYRLPELSQSVGRYSPIRP